MKTPARTRSLLFFLFCVSVLGAAVPPSTTINSRTLSVRTINGYLMVVGVTLNGQGPFDFLVDTGTNTSLLDPALASDLKLKPVDRMALATLADATPAVRYYADTLQAGPASVAHLELLGAPLEQLRSLDDRIRGVLGMNFLLQFSFLLDFPHRRMEIYPFPESAPAPAGLRLHVQINESRILVPVISDAAPKGAWNLVLDSGIGQFLVFKSRIRTLERPCEQAPCLMQVATNGSSYSAPTLTIPELSIANSRFFDQPVVVLRNELLNPADPQDGLLPASLFRSVFFDRSNGTLVVETR